MSDIVKYERDGDVAVITLNRPDAMNSFNTELRADVAAAFEKARNTPGPKLLHVLTVKGYGFAPAEADPIKYHAVPGFDPVTGATPPKTPRSSAAGRCANKIPWPNPKSSLRSRPPASSPP